MSLIFLALFLRDSLDFFGRGYSAFGGRSVKTSVTIHFCYHDLMNVRNETTSTLLPAIRRPMTEM